MPERMSESNLNEEESLDRTSSGLEEEGDTAPRKTPSTGARLWDRVRSSLLRPKVKIRTVSCGRPGIKDTLYHFFFLNCFFYCLFYVKCWNVTILLLRFLHQL